ncbi:MAG TPA: type II toxin-antitoxin system HicB family antitoxin [Chloroflexota bacterium]|nr:type II toxin-antitoxin system HicB family antitoxin [Chloroflexota bacterium]
MIRINPAQNSDSFLAFLDQLDQELGPPSDEDYAWARSFVNVEQDVSPVLDSPSAAQGRGRGNLYKIPLVLTPQPEGGYTVTSPVLPELVTEGDTIAEALANVEDAFQAIIEIYRNQGRSLPSNLRPVDQGDVIWLDYLVTNA